MQRAQKVAYQIISGFDKNYRLFSRITKGGQTRFENGHWVAAHQAIKERITIYEQSLTDVVNEIYRQVMPHQTDDAFWLEMKTRFAQLIVEHPQFELAETFYNSVIGRVFRHQQINNDYMFLAPSRCYLPGPDRNEVVIPFDTTGTVRHLFEEILDYYRFNIPYEDRDRDLQNLDNALRERMTKEERARVHTVEMLKPVFYRGRAAYFIGRICSDTETLPFIISLRNRDGQAVFVDALLLDREDLSVIFGFARSYFCADTQLPAEIVAFLHELIPNKKQFELYMSIGHFKHGKTEFYRNYLQHIQQSDDMLEIAPGIKGLVMAVFHLPSYGVVFKVIKDEFPESKKITRDDVKDRYRLVKMSDRVGRMADTHEYANFHFPKNRFDPELLAYLQETCANSLVFTEDEIIIKHLYIERKMTPLNLFLQQESDPKKIRNALDELGLCIKQISLTNLFPGDMLHKNFGITKHGRVIFYDYDEITYMHERNFRTLPVLDDPFAMDTVSVGPEDVFPQQFEHFIVGKREFKEILKELHGDLMTAEYWQALQAKAKDGEIKAFTPYNPKKSFFFTETE